ncbi:MAG: CBS domain-containing protein [Thermoanaerobaculia bacterium]|nr:CBS domain-containing protein [Thermoanaerobaculia bacterium]
MRRLCASDVMNPEVLTVRERMAVQDLAEFLIDNEISGAPVVDDEGRLVGVVSMVDIVAAASEAVGFATDDRRPDFYLRDLADSFSEEEIKDLQIEQETSRVGDIMTPSIYSVSEDTSVSEVASMMLRAHLHRVLVTREEALVGIISTSDLLGLLVDETP